MTTSLARIESCAIARAQSKRPPRGMIMIDGKWQVRFAGFIRQRELTCYNSHHVHAKKGERPIEGVIPCGYKEPPHGRPCQARLFVFRTRARVLFAMDITPDEDDHIELAEMDLDDIIEHFGLSFPPRVKR
jgi:hypothetical protein